MTSVPMKKVEKILKLLEEATDALESIACGRHPKIVTRKFWTKEVGLNGCVEVILTDTRLARNTLRKIKKGLK